MAISSHDITPDSPTNTFATLNPLPQNSNTTWAATLLDGNLKHVTSSDERYAPSTFLVPTNGKWYIEALYLDTPTTSSYNTGGLVAPTTWNFQYPTTSGSDFSGFEDSSSTYTQKLIQEGSATGTSFTCPSGTLVGFEINGDTGELTLYKNGNSVGTVTYDNASDKVFVVGNYNNTTIVNFGQDPTFGGNKNTPATVTIDGQSVTGPFAPSGTAAGTAGLFYYPPPADALALCTANLPSAPDLPIDPAVDDLPEDYFKAVIWTGNNTGTSRTITVGFGSDLIWTKRRDGNLGTSNHLVYDSVRGAGNRLQTNTTASSSSNDIYGYINNIGTTSFTFTDGTDATYPRFYYNDNNGEYVAWCFRAGGSPSATDDGTGVNATGSAKLVNTSGAASSTTCKSFKDAAVTAGASNVICPSKMSINQKAGFSIVKYVGNGNNNASFPHGLTQTPDIVIIKNLDTTTNWYVSGYPNLSPFTSNNKLLALNSALDIQTASSNATTNGTNVITINLAGGDLNSTATNYIAYCWHSVTGYSAFGSYTGNGSTDGPFVYTGFKPAWVMIKSSSYTTTTYTSWAIYDNARETYNPNNNVLYANKSINEGYRGDASTAATDIDVDFLSNGFKVRSDKAEINQDTETYIYAAFAEMPYRYSATNAR